MLTLSFTFPAGRYHATPWDRHVNEGAVAWPPEPWRILRALIATWHHKVKWMKKHREATLLGLIESLAQELPEYMVPPASHSHTRHYMPQFAAGKTSLVFDAFAAVDRQETLTVVWPNVELPDEQGALLDDLVAVMGYLGRAESWVEVRRLDETPEVPETRKCKPGTDPIDAETGELRGEAVTLLAPLPANEYEALRSRFLSDDKAIKKLHATLPGDLLQALSVETADLRKHGWNQPPAARKVGYLRPLDALRPVRAVREPVPPRATTVRYILVGKPLPRVEDSVRIGEIARQAVMSQAKRMVGNDAIPPVFCGHGLREGNRHGHAFYLPWDSNGDGYIDRLLVHVPDGMGAAQRGIVERLQRLWIRGGGEWRVVIEGIGDADVGGSLMDCATEWQSVTPYLHPWHAKRQFGVREQICRECRERGLPEPLAFEPIEEIPVGSQKRGPIRFRRIRNKRGLNQPDRHGSFWRLTFPEAVDGPVALGFGCHFGLGLFAPVMDR